MELSIGKNIYKRRKDKGFTQEQLANELGISPAAVSKWETGSAYPDITLLTPLARLLNSTVDDLLGFEAHLSEQRVEQLCSNCARAFETDLYDSAVKLGEAYLGEYPNSFLLKLRLGNVFFMHIACAKTEEAASQLMQRVKELMQAATDSEEIWVQEAAWHSLCAILLSQKKYEEALHALEKIHKPAADPEMMKVSVYYAMGDLEKSKQMAQYLLWSHLSACGLSLVSLAKIAKKQGDVSLAIRIEQTNLQLSRLFEREKQYGQDLNHVLMIAECYAEQGLKEKALQTLAEFVKCAKLPMNTDWKGNPFFDELQGCSTAVSKNYLNQCAYQMVEENPAFNSFKNDSDFIHILEELKRLPQ